MNLIGVKFTSNMQKIREYYREIKMSQKKSTLSNITAILIGCLMLGGFASTADASHKKNAPPFDIAAKGTNYSGYASIGECTNAKNEVCQIMIQQCGPNNSKIYVTKRVGLLIVRNMRDGQKLPVYTMTSSGHFKDKICTIGF